MNASSIDAWSVSSTPSEETSLRQRRAVAQRPEQAELDRADDQLEPNTSDDDQRRRLGQVKPSWPVFSAQKA